MIEGVVTKNHPNAPNLPKSKSEMRIWTGRPKAAIPSDSIAAIQALSELRTPDILREAFGGCKAGGGRILVGRETVNAQGSLKAELQAGASSDAHRHPLGVHALACLEHFQDSSRQRHAVASAFNSRISRSVFKRNWPQAASMSWPFSRRSVTRILCFSNAARKASWADHRGVSS